MSRETEKILKALSQNRGGREMTADDYLEKAYDAESEEEAIKYAKKALKLDKNCLDAKLLIIEANQEIEKAKIDLEKAIAIEKKRLEEDGLFDEENIGSFYMILETRPYMRACASYVELLIIMGKIKKAVAECEQLIELNSNDNMGMRYKLMGLYAMLSDAQGAEELYKRYKEESSFMFLYPQALLYYKLDDLKKARPLVKKLAQVNTAYVDFVTGKLELDQEEIAEIGYRGMYAPGTIEEVIVGLGDNPYLSLTVGSFTDWIAQEYLKAAARKK